MSSGRLMRHISPSRSPIHDRPIAIRQMRLAATLLGDHRHLDHPPRADLGLSPDQQLIQLILGVTPQLHDPNVQPGCDRKSRQPDFRPTRNATPSPSPSASNSRSAKASRNSPGQGSESPGLGANFAQAGNGEQTTRRQPVDQLSIQPWFPVHVTDDQIHGWPRRQTIIEIPHLEPAPVGNTTPNGQLAGQIDGDRRDIDTEHVHPAKGEPHRQLAAPSRRFPGRGLRLGTGARSKRTPPAGRAQPAAIPSRHAAHPIAGDRPRSRLAQYGLGCFRSRFPDSSRRSCGG